MIEDYIPCGYENRVSRQYLVDILHIPDRQIRRQIEEARERRVLIASYNGGYFQYRDERDKPYFDAYNAMEEKRFKTQSHNNKLRREAMAMLFPPEKKDRQIPGQMSLFDEVSR